MYILAFETSCDDTSVALFDDDKLIAMDTASQIKIHEETGGVVPEVAAREHANNIFKVLDRVLVLSGVKLNQINHIAVTVTPGLIPSLLTGITVAKTISKTLQIPLIEINHIEAHIFSNYLERKESDINYPLVCLTVSGGHNEIYLMKDMFDFKKIGGTQDDSAGEAFDKVAKMMGLGYPGGPIISKLAEEYRNNEKGKIENGVLSSGMIVKDPLSNETSDKQCLRDSSLHSEGQFNSVHSKKLFPRSWLVKEELNFSFSGLKSSVKREIEKRKSLCHTECSEAKSKYPLNENDIGEQCLRDSSTSPESSSGLKAFGMTTGEYDLSIEDKQEIAFEFQEAVTEVLATKLVNAAEMYGVKTIMLAGGVSANDRLKKYINELIKGKDIKFIYPVKKVYSMDNAAMVGINAYYKIKNNKF